MYSWGPECKLVTGAYGGVTFDAQTRQFVHACEPWTKERLPYSCTPLQLLPVKPCNAKDEPKSPSIEQQIDWLRSKQRPHKNDHIPEDILTEVMNYDRNTIEADSRPRHNCLHLTSCENFKRERIILCSHIYSHNKLRTSRLYEQVEPFNKNDYELLDDNYISPPVQLAGGLLKICGAQRAPLMAALTSTSHLHFWNTNTCLQPMDPVKVIDDEAFDIDISSFGNYALIGTKSGCRLFDIQKETFAKNWLVETSFGIKYCSTLCEFTNVAASLNKLLLFDNRNQRHATLPFDIGGQPLALTCGYNTNSLLYLSGTERMMAIDLRRPKVPIIQWQHKESFGGRLGMLRVIPISTNDGQRKDLLTAVNLDTEELVMLPIQSEPSLNTISVLSSALQSSLNVNRAYIRLQKRQRIIGHDWLQLHDDQWLSVHQTADGKLAYQMHSFSDKFKDFSIDSADLLEEEPIPKPVCMRLHQRLSHGELLLECITGKRNYVEIDHEQQEALAGWQVPTRSNRYIPRLLARALSSRADQISVNDLTLLSSAARILYKEWDI